MAYALDKSTVVPDFAGGNTWSGTQAFNGRSGNSSLSAIGIDAEGYPIATYTNTYANAAAVTGNPTPYTCIIQRGTGPSVIIASHLNEMNANSTEGYPAGLGIADKLYGDAVYNAIWNDMVDCIDVPEDTDLEYGYCYCFDGEKYQKSSKYLDPQVIGIHSDSYGFGIGLKESKKQLKICVAGFVLAHVDKQYKPGTPLTCTKDGYLTEFKQEDLEKYPWLLVGTFWKPEGSQIWGNSARSVEVNGRMWVKVV